MSALNTLLLLQYNNYYNRIIKKEDSVDDYIEDNTYKYVTGVNFNPNDGVTTEQIINWSESWNPDYCVILDGQNIVSRWFITESARTRGKQFKISLKRDCIADYYDVIKESPCFIEKGYVPRSNSLLYNSEGFQCNQIKVSEEKLLDSSNCSWLVVYYDKSKKTQLKGTVINTTNYSIKATVSSTFANWEYNIYCQGNGVYKKPYDWRYNFLMKSSSIGSAVRRKYVVNNDATTNNWGIVTSGSTTLLNNEQTPSFYMQDTVDKVTAGGAMLKSTAETFVSEPVAFDTLLSYLGYVQFTDGIYQVRIEPLETATDTKTIASTDSIYTQLRNLFYVDGELDDNYNGSISPEVFSIDVDYTKYTIVGTKIVDNTVNYDFSGSHNEIEDQPYGVIALPYQPGIDGLRFGSTSTNYAINSNLSMAIVQDLVRQGGGTSPWIYDAQIIPFCPISLITITSSSLNVLYTDISSLTSNSLAYIKDANDNKVGFVVYPLKTKYTGNITKHIACEYTTSDVNLNRKIENECTFYRLCSPNFNGQFEFNLAKNGGTVEYFNYDVTLKPYAPYIHVNPDFKGLYGYDANDPRGLLCGGDFSTTQLTSAWETYQRQNVNYEKIFDREIQNMDTTHNIDMISSAANVLTSTAKGAVGGSLAKNPNPAMIGLGAAAGLVSGATGLITNQAKYNEQLSYTKDMHEYQLGNVKALPNSLSKVDAYNNNNKIFVVLEKYTCKDDEKNIFVNKLTYDNMTINAIGTLGQFRTYYAQNVLKFFRGQIIRLEGLNEDSHMANDIYNEIKQGVYL